MRFFNILLAILAFPVRSFRKWRLKRYWERWYDENELTAAEEAAMWAQVAAEAAASARLARMVRTGVPFM